MNLQVRDKYSYRQKVFFWNLAGAAATASSSVLLLMAVKRFAGMKAGADYAMAAAIGNTLMNVGHLNGFGCQTSDVAEKYSFQVYLRLRKFTILMMVLICVLYVRMQGYGLEKGAVVVLYCIYKAVYVLADVYQGRYQQKGRADLAGKLQFIKTFFPDTILGLFIWRLAGVGMAFLIAIPAECMCIYFFNRVYFRDFSDANNRTYGQCASLFMQCLPLFFSAFTTTYILNSSKYAIDKLLDAGMQVYYSVLLLPATTVHMIAGIIYRPMITEYAWIWEKGDVIRFQRCIRKIFGIIAGTLLLAEFLSGLVILPVLEMLYGISDLHDYQADFFMILLAGGLNALNTFLGYLITIMKQLRHMYWIYGLAFAMALFLPDLLVGYLGFAGAAGSFLLLVLLQTIFMYGVYRRGLKRAVRSHA